MLERLYDSFPNLSNHVCVANKISSDNGGGDSGVELSRPPVLSSGSLLWGRDCVLLSETTVAAGVKWELVVLLSITNFTTECFRVETGTVHDGDSTIITITTEKYRTNIASVCVRWGFVVTGVPHMLSPGARIRQSARGNSQSPASR